MKNKLPISVLLLTTLVLSACSPDPTMPMSTGATVQLQDQNRVQVTRIGVFEDDLSYNGLRGVYVIRDNKTDTEYIGISGVGIQELGKRSGKSNSGSVER